MKKCPKCKKEIPDRYQYCPYCGTNVQKNNNRNRLLFYALIFAMPFLYYLVLGNINLPNTSNEPVVLKDVDDRQATAIIYQYQSLEEFDTKVENADSYIQDIKTYENNIPTDANREYLISILDNNDVNFKLQYSFMNNNTLINIHKQYTKSDSLDYIEYSFTKSGMTSLKDIVIDREVIEEYVDSKVFDTLYNQLLLREDDFNKKIDHIGHFGYGEYSDDASIVVYPDGDSFKVTFKYKVMK